LLDAGASTVQSPEGYVTLARLGLAFARYAFGIGDPNFGLLNIGSESNKGTPLMRKAYQLLQSHFPKTVFHGNVEPKDAFDGKVDVVVTDGFMGNLFLKTAEGVSNHVTKERRFDPKEYPGALVAGVDGIVIKCHGSSSQSSIVHSIQSALDFVRCGVISLIHQSGF